MMGIADEKFQMPEDDMTSDNNMRTTDEIAVKPSPYLTRFQMVVVILFAWTGSCSVKIMQNYPAAFYLKFLQDNDLNKTYGSIAISTAMVTMLISPYIAQWSPKWKHRSLWLRSLCAILVNLICNVVLGLVDVVTKTDTTGTATYFVIGITRALQGASMGILFVTAYGEIIDIFFKNNNFIISIISSAIHISFVVGSNTAAQTYQAGGWAVTGPAIAAFNILPLVFIPIIRSYEKSKFYFEAAKEEKECSEITSEDKINQRPLLTKWQMLVFYLPDIAVFVNSMTFNMVVYVLPLRAFNFSGMSLNRAVLIISIIYVAGFICSFLVAFLASKKVDVFMLMIGLNTVYYLGFVLTYGSTTDLLGFPYAFEIGSLLVGIGIAGHVNLCVVSQFALYEKWGVSIEGVDLGKKCATLFNVMIAGSSVLGIVVSGLPASRESEIPTLIYLGIAYLIASVCFTMCKVQSTIFAAGRDEVAYKAACIT